MPTIAYYETSLGTCPVREYIDSLAADDAAQVVYGIDLLEELGVRLDAPHVRHIEGKLWELRIHGANKQHRIIYFAASGQKMVLLHAFTKKTQKTRRTEIKTALRRMADYLESVTSDEPPRLHTRERSD